MSDESMKEKTHIEKVRDCFEDGSAEINGRSYKFCKMNHRKRLQIFGYSSGLKSKLINQDLSFIGTDDQIRIEELMFSNMTFNDSKLSSIDNHFEKYGEDYIMLFTMAMAVFSYPFMKGNL
jgi:hypothetical protein